MEEKQRQILEGSYKIFITDGFKNISMEDLCRRLGISKKTLYRFFWNKSHLLTELNRYIYNQISKRIQQLEQKGLNAIDFLLELSKVTCETHLHINPEMITEFKTWYPKEYEQYMSLKKELLVKTILRNLENGIKEGFYRKDLKLEIIAHLYFRKIEEFHMLSAEKSAGFTFPDIFRVMFENHIRGIANEKGIAYFEKQKKHLVFTV
jgi:TetR/AcrR family transcriptional regulator, cholesterol catabolism regulator